MTKYGIPKRENKKVRFEQPSLDPSLTFSGVIRKTHSLAKSYPSNMHPSMGRCPWKLEVAYFHRHTVDGRNPFRTGLRKKGNRCSLVFTGESSFQGFLGGAGFCPSTVG